MEENKPKKIGRPRLSEEEKKERAEKRKTGELPIQRRNRPDLVNFGQENIQPGDNTKYLRHAIATMNMPPIDTSSAEQVSERIAWYFNHCADSDMKPTVNGLCNALGIHRDSLRSWRIGEYRQGTHQEIVLRAYRIIEELWEDYMLNGKINPVSGIFLAKNMFSGYSDKQEFVLTPNAPGLSETDIGALEQKYAELPEDIE